MVIIWGSGLYGRTDEVPGLGHVATNFGHLWYIPLIPVGSHFVIEQTGDGWRGAPISLSGKSILIGWLRALIVGIIVGIVGTTVSFLGPDRSAGWKGLVILAALIVALVLMNRMTFFTRASYRRACQLSDTLEFGEEARVIIDLAYDEIDEQEAEIRLNEIGEDGKDALEGHDEFVIHTDS